MLKKLIVALIIGMVSISSIGCGSSDSSANSNTNSESTSIKSNTRPTEAQIEKQITYWAGSSEKVENVKVDGHDISIKIDLGNDTSVDLACTRFSNVTDNLLKDNYWKTIKISFNDLGSIEMNSSDAIGNDKNDKYFPNAEIRKHLKLDEGVKSKHNSNNTNSDNKPSKDTQEIKRDSSNNEHRKSNNNSNNHKDDNNQNNNKNI